MTQEPASAGKSQSTDGRSIEWLAELADQLRGVQDPWTEFDRAYPRLSELLELDFYGHYCAGDDHHLILQDHRGLSGDQAGALGHVALDDVLGATLQAAAPRPALGNTELARKLTAGAYFAAPVMVDGSVREVMVFASRRRSAFDSGDLALLRLTGHQISSAVQRRHLTAELARGRVVMEQDQAGGAGRSGVELERRRLQAVLDVLPVAVFVADETGKVTAANAAAGLIWGRLPVLSPSLEDHAEDYRTYAPGTNRAVSLQDRGLFQAIHGQRVTGKEVDVVRPDGRRSLLVYAAPIRDDASRIIGGASVATDVTDLKRVQRQLLELNDALEQRVRDRTRSLLSYQVQMRAMASELILTEQRERRRLAAELHDYLAQLLVAGKMKSKLVSRHLNTEAGAAALGEVRDLIDESLKYTRTLIADLSPTILYEAGFQAAMIWLGERMLEQGLTVSIEAEGEPVELPHDQAVLVYQTVRELLFNVVKHAGVKAAVVHLADPASGELAVTVSDDGAGFEPARQTAMEPGGGKFGLFSIRERLVALGGSFQLTSSPGHGTQATIRVPLPSQQPVIETSEAPVSNVTGLTPLAMGPAQRGVRVLLADDHKMVREGFRSLIESDPQLEVAGEAANGEEAVELARLLQPDVIVMDINMPRMNGIEATRRIKSEMPHIAIIGLSVHDDRGLTASMLDAGAACYLTKGGPSEDLARAIHDAHAGQLA